MDPEEGKGFGVPCWCTGRPVLLGPERPEKEFGLPDCPECPKSRSPRSHHYWPDDVLRLPFDPWDLFFVLLRHTVRERYPEPGLLLTDNREGHSVRFGRDRVPPITIAVSEGELAGDAKELADKVYAEYREKRRQALEVRL